jgi:hypothetical protein
VTQDPDQFYRGHRESLTEFATALAGSADVAERAVVSALAESYQHYVRHRMLSPTGHEPLQWLKALIARQIVAGRGLTALARRAARDRTIAILRWGYCLDCAEISELLDISLAAARASTSRTASRFMSARQIPNLTRSEINQESLDPAEGTVT